MSINLIKEVTQNLRRVRNEVTNRQQKEAYLQMSSKLNQVLQTTEKQQSMYKQMANMANEAGNPMLEQQFLEFSRKKNQELQAIYDLMRLARSIANQ